MADDLSNRIGNDIYHAARSGSIKLTGFPDFAPVLSALKTVADTQVEKSYKVCAPIGSNLAVLQVYAQKWLDDDLTSERANQIITEHNEKFNPSGEFVQPEGTQRTSSFQLGSEVHTMQILKATFGVCAMTVTVIAQRLSL